MVRRGATVAVVALLLAGTSSYHRIPIAPAIIVPTAAHAAETDLRDNPPRGSRLAGNGQPTPGPRVVLGAATTSKVVALTFDLDMNAQMAAAAHAGAVWINRDALAYLESRKLHATLFLTGMWAEVYPALARELASNPNFEIGDHSYSHPAFHTPCYRLRGGHPAEEARQSQHAEKATRRTTRGLPKSFRVPRGGHN